MQIKKTEIDLSDERKLLINCITSTEFLSGISPVLDAKLLQSRYAKIVIDWVKEYFTKYEQAPAKNIQDIFLSKNNVLEETEYELISKMLSSLSDESEQHNIPYSLDQAEIYLKRQKLKQTRDHLDDEIAGGDLLKAEAVICNYTKLERPTSSGIDITESNAEPIIDYEAETIFKFPGALGELCGSHDRIDFPESGCSNCIPSLSSRGN